MERRKLINAELSKVSINLQQFYLDDNIMDMLDLLVIEQGYEHEGTTLDDMLQYIVLNYMNREKPELVEQVFGQANIDSFSWLNDYRLNRFDPAYENGCNQAMGTALDKQYSSVMP